MLGKRIRQLGRYREIVSVFARHGFGFVIEDTGLGRLFSLPKRLLSHELDTDLTVIGQRFRKVMEDLGPTFVKLGQIASTRPDIIPIQIIRELEKLQDDVPPFPYSEVAEILEQQLGASVIDLFKSFSSEPLAAASIGQVHKAVLHTGEEVAVKIQRPHIHQQIETDLEILADIADLVEDRFSWGKLYQIKNMVGEFSRSLRAELDYSAEGKNAEKIGRIFKEEESIAIPKVYWEYSSPKVLTLEFFQGLKLNRIDELEKMGHQPKEIAERLVRATLEQALNAGFFHGDPHPGNILILPDRKLAYLDFGMVGRLTPDMKFHFSTLVIGLMRQNTDGLIEGLLGMGIVPDDVDMDKLRQEMDDLREKYVDLPLSKVGMGDAMTDLFAIAFQHRIRIPADLTLLGKTLLTLEGVVEKLDPDLSILNIAEPYGRRLFKERYGISGLSRRIFQDLGQYGSILFNLPQQVKEMLRKMSKGRFQVDVTLENQDAVMKRLDRLANRIALSMVLLAFSLVLMGFIIASALQNRPIVLLNFPVVEVGLGIGTVLFLWLLYSITRSGKL